jgi:hypothetical protein
MPRCRVAGNSSVTKNTVHDAVCAVSLSAAAGDTVSANTYLATTAVIGNF